jgi:hypothetical protein
LDAVHATVAVLLVCHASRVQGLQYVVHVLCLHHHVTHVRRVPVLVCGLVKKEAQARTRS